MSARIIVMIVMLPCLASKTIKHVCTVSKDTIVKLTKTNLCLVLLTKIMS